MTALLDSTESGFEFEVEMIARCIALGLPIAEVPIRTIYAGEPSHIRPWRHFTSSCASPATRGGSSAAADRALAGSGYDVAPVRDLGDEDVLAAQQRLADPPAVLVVEEPLPPVARHVLGEQHDEHVVAVARRRVLEVADERPDERAVRRLDDDERHARQLAREPLADRSPAASVVGDVDRA